MITVLTGAAFILGIWGEGAVPNELKPIVTVSAFLLPWLFWGFLFYRLYRNSSDPVTGAVKWLLRGSVLELLIAVPAHVMVRRRHECCAPDITAFGITTGIAIMFLSFGPAVLLLLKARMEKISPKETCSFRLIEGFILICSGCPTSGRSCQKWGFDFDFLCGTLCPLW